MRVARVDAEGLERLILRVTALALLLATAGCSRSAAGDPGFGRWATVNGHRLYYEVRGEGPPIVLLHAGGGTISETFGAQLAPFSAHHRVIAPEQIGHGHTPNVSGPLTYTRMADDTAQLLQQLKVSNAGVVGLSDGAILALMLAARHPELVRRVVASGANIDPAGLIPGELEETRKQTGNSDSIGDKLGHLWMESPKPDELSIGILKKIQQPVLVMAGDQDVVTPEHTLLIYRSLPHALLWILPDTGHHTLEQRPDWVNSAILSFLDGK